jgi:hypothetical protein
MITVSICLNFMITLSICLNFMITLCIRLNIKSHTWIELLQGCDVSVAWAETAMAKRKANGGKTNKNSLGGDHESGEEEACAGSEDDNGEASDGGVSDGRPDPLQRSCHRGFIFGPGWARRSLQAP